MARKNKNNKNKVKSPRLPPLFITPTLRPNRPPRLTSSSSCCARGLPPDCAPPTHAAAHTKGELSSAAKTTTGSWDLVCGRSPVIVMPRLARVSIGIASCIPSLSTAGNLYEEEPKILDLERKAALLPRPRLRQALTSQIPHAHRRPQHLPVGRAPSLNTFWGSQYPQSFGLRIYLLLKVFVVGRLVVYLLRRSGGRAGGPRPGVGPARAARICAAPQSEGLYGCKLPGASPAHAAAAAPARPPKPLGLTPLPPRLTGCRVQPHLPARTRAPHALLQASLCCCPPRPPGGRVFLTSSHRAVRKLSLNHSMFPPRPSSISPLTPPLSPHPLSTARPPALTHYHVPAGAGGRAAPPLSRGRRRSPLLSASRARQGNPGEKGTLVADSFRLVRSGMSPPPSLPPLPPRANGRKTSSRRRRPPPARPSCPPHGMEWPPFLSC
ncbi:hypothetical protein C7M84_005314 [Penaeus vannamei]|uniref:Uncharacterized protein n=1 Tax=Penaeus vannamei TaxID=6689 RepID=A0A423TI64_PENVA|nr:hypothetical protein C7M84_005314 [Penaeus vannamei]